MKKGILENVFCGQKVQIVTSQEDCDLTQLDLDFYGAVIGECVVHGGGFTFTCCVEVGVQCRVKNVVMLSFSCEGILQ